MSTSYTKELFVMSTFIEEVASRLYDKYGDEVSSLTVVMPSKRARLFFAEALAKVTVRPVWEPTYTSMDDLMCRQSGLLKADICQMAHHGQNGCDRAFYEAVSPEICLWCTPLWLWNNDRGKGFNTHIWKTVTVRGWMDEIGVKTNLKICDGTQVLELD